MKCERCNERESSVHLTEIIKGVKSEVHLCEKCAKDIGLNSKLSNFSLTVPDFLSIFNDENRDSERKNVCKQCKTDIRTIISTKKVGCSYCYHFFDSKIATFLEADESEYHGRVPRNYVEIKEDLSYKEDSFTLEDSVDQLKDQLTQAVGREEYEQAAVLRDKIRNLEQMCRSRS